MGTTERFTRREFQRILDVTDKQLTYWEKLRLISPRRRGSDKSYDFRDLISLRTAKQLIETGVSASRLRRSLAALNHQLAEVQAPLNQLRILSNGRDIIVEQHGARLEPISGQFVLNFDTRELSAKVRVMPERSAEDWFALALQYESDPDSRVQAIEAYQRVLKASPHHIDALINVGMLFYEQGELESAAGFLPARGSRGTGQCRGALQSGQRAGGTRQAGSLAKASADCGAARPAPRGPHYNLAFVCDRLGSRSEARQHWQTYIKLDPASPWCTYARQRLAVSKP